MNAQQLEALQQLARQATTLEWGSEEQIEAQNSFYEVVLQELADPLREQLNRYLHRATTQEGVEEAFRLLGVEFFTEAEIPSLSNGK